MNPPPLSPWVPARIQARYCLLIAVLGLLVYANHLWNPFQFDTVAYVTHKHSLDHPERILTLEFLKGGYFDRGLLQMTLAWNTSLSGLQSLGFHLLNLAVHILNTILIFFITQNIRRDLGAGERLWTEKENRRVALFTALLFLCHPIQTESVVYVMSRAGILAATLYLSAFYVFQQALEAKNRSPLFLRVGVPILATLAALGIGFSIKQSIATLPAMLLFYYLCGWSGEGEPGPIRFLRRWKWAAGALVVLGLSVLMWKLLTDESFLIGPSRPEEMVGRKNYMLSQPPVLLYYYLKLLFFPVNLNIDPDIEVVTRFFSWRFLSASALILGLFFLASRGRERRMVLFFLAWFFVVLSPSSSIVTLHDLAAEHRVYLASYGFFFLFSHGLFALIREFPARESRRGVLALCLVVYITGSLAAMTIKRNLVWADEVTLWEDASRKSPRLVRPWINLGRAHSMAGHTGEAISFYEKALEKRPHVFAANYNLAVLYLERGRVEEAIPLFKHAHEVEPRIAEVPGKLGELYLNLGKYEEADRYFKKAVELNPQYAVAMRNLGILNYFHLHRPREGILYFKRALTLDPEQLQAGEIRQLIAAQEQHGKAESLSGK
ncbi:MAG: tetratricopeptide repeat protein [Nitrospinaceae bacterium]